MKKYQDGDFAQYDADDREMLQQYFSNQLLPHFEQSYGAAEAVDKALEWMRSEYPDAYSALVKPKDITLNDSGTGNFLGGVGDAFGSVLNIPSSILAEKLDGEDGINWSRALGISDQDQLAVSQALGIQNPYVGFGVDLLADPLNYISGAGILKYTNEGRKLLNSLNKGRKFLGKSFDVPVPFLDTFRGIDNAITEMRKGGGRLFQEMLPITKAQKERVMKMQDDAFRQGDDFARQWNIGLDDKIRPFVQERLRVLGLDPVNNIMPGYDFSMPFQPEILFRNYGKNAIISTVGKPKHNPLLVSLSKKGINNLRGELTDAQIYSMDKHRRWANASGVNFGGEKSITYRNVGPYYYLPSKIRHTAAHEGAHTAQKAITDNGDQPFLNLVKYDDKTDYIAANEDNIWGKNFKKYLKDEYWLKSPLELHADMYPARMGLIDEWLKKGWARNLEEGIEKLQKLESSKYTNAEEYYLKEKKLNRFFKKDAPDSEKIRLLKLLPAGGLGMYMMSQQNPEKAQFGGIPTSPLGQWQYPGQVVNVPSDSITMKGINHPNIGISDNGILKKMMPGKDYKFPGASSVLEIPIMKEGGPVGFDNLIDFIKSTETFSEKPYSDYKQISIGYGTKAKEGETSITEEEAHQRLVDRINEDRARVEAFSKKHGYQWNDRQKDALVSFIYNVGPGGLDQVTDYGKRDEKTIASKMLEYNKVTIKDKETGKYVKVPNESLTKRRQIESNVFSGQGGKYLDLWKGILPDNSANVEVSSDFTQETFKEAHSQRPIPQVVSNKPSFSLPITSMQKGGHANSPTQYQDGEYIYGDDKGRVASDFNDAKEYLQSYYSSPMFKDRLLEMFKKANLSDIYGDVEGLVDTMQSDFLDNLLTLPPYTMNPGRYSHYDPETRTINLDPYQSHDGEYVLDQSTISHELSHAAISSSKNINSKYAYEHALFSEPFGQKMAYDILNQIGLSKFPRYYVGRKDGKRQYEEIDPSNRQALKSNHDFNPLERKADIDSIRHTLYKKGIYDARTEKFDKSHLEQMRNIDEFIIKRMFNLFNDDQIIEYMNSIASVPANTSNVVMTAMKGGYPNSPELEAMSKVLTYRNRDLPWIKRVLEGSELKLDAGNGMDKTHRLGYAGVDDGYIVYPTIIQEGDKLKEFQTDDEAIDYAFANKTGMFVPSRELAEYYSKNGLIKHFQDGAFANLGSTAKKIISNYDADDREMLQQYFDTQLVPHFEQTYDPAEAVAEAMTWLQKKYPKAYNVLNGIEESVDENNNAQELQNAAIDNTGVVRPLVSDIEGYSLPDDLIPTIDGQGYFSPTQNNQEVLQRGSGLLMNPDGTPGQLVMASGQINPVDDPFTGLIGFTSLLKNISTKSLQNAYKLNPFANKLGRYNRVVSKEAIDDAIESQVIRVKAPASKQASSSGVINLDRRGTTPFPSFGEGKISADNAYLLDIIKRGESPYIISTNRPMGASTLVRHGKGSTLFPVDKSGSYLRSFPIEEAELYNAIPHWLKGYMKVPKKYQTGEFATRYGTYQQVLDSLPTRVIEAATTPIGSIPNPNNPNPDPTQTQNEPIYVVGYDKPSKAPDTYVEYNVSQNRIASLGHLRDLIDNNLEGMISNDTLRLSIKDALQKAYMAAGATEMLRDAPDDYLITTLRNNPDVVKSIIDKAIKYHTDNPDIRQVPVGGEEGYSFTPEMERPGGGYDALGKLFNNVIYKAANSYDDAKSFIDTIPKGSNLMYLDHSGDHLFGVPDTTFLDLIRSANPKLCIGGSCLGEKKYRGLLEEWLPDSDIMLSKGLWYGFDMNQDGFKTVIKKKGGYAKGKTKRKKK